jgi:RNA polymerase sigma factor FliA
MPEIYQDVHNIWTEYSNNRAIEQKQQLILHYIWLVKYVLQSMNFPNHSLLSDSDFLNFGILGLHEAIERFELERGVKFETYAIPRIKGTIQDELRRLDWLSRTARRKAHEFLHAGDELRSKEGREVSIEEIRIKMQVSQEEYQSYLSAAAAAKASLFLSESTQTLLDEDGSLEELVDDSQESILTKLQNEEQINFLVDYLKALPDKKRNVMSLYYYENMTFKEIGQVLEVSEGRICQIHTQVIKDLRLKMNEFENA